ncbi:hypothetical protein [Thiobaca trueperi]|uniref:Uncharacterized protein n=1 Tax=Thiobaca trueperi TaxID=127458 RepID=A0A4R3N2B3_9GAMM|nr:hypothetical protein [Thiobaca trueperi]TCT21183.1 hypothetical protein EDC35_10436 [Thiobaca trueperi]
MTDQANLAAQLADLQAQMAALRPAAPAPSASAWANAMPALSAAPTINGVAVPVKIQTPAGSIRVYLSLPAECAASPDALMSALEALAAAGLPLDTWSGARESGSAWGNSRSNGGWSGNSNRNTWRR